MAAFNLTYTSLVSLTEQYSENSTSDFTDRIPGFIALAENRIAAEARGLGFLLSVTDDLVEGQQFLTKPARWRETASIQIGTGATYDIRLVLMNRDLEFIRSYWPNATTTGQPKYYGDWEYQQWLLAPTPDDAYPYEVIYYQRPQPLDAENSTNWTTEYAPQLILYATLLEAQMFLKRDDRIAVFQPQYDRALKQVEFEQKRRMRDRAASTTNA